MRISVGAFIPAAPFQAIASRASRRSPAGSGPTHRQTLPLGGVCVNRTSMQSSIGDRDNCVFEAGLFMGVIGRNRCFFVSSAAKSELPSDLEGIIIFNFSEPNDLSNREACGNAIRSVSSNIKDSVQEVRRQNTRRGAATGPFSRDELLDREQLDPYGELQEDQVIVASLQPLDLKYETALRVWNNLNNNISYVYFFEANTDTADKITQLLQLLLLAGIVGIPNPLILKPLSNKDESS